MNNLERPVYSSSLPKSSLVLLYIRVYFTYTYLRNSCFTFTVCNSKGEPNKFLSDCGRFEQPWRLSFRIRWSTILSTCNGHRQWPATKTSDGREEYIYVLYL